MLDATTVTYLMVSAINFIVGAITGWYLAKFYGDADEAQVRHVMAIVMLAAYIISILAEISVRGYQTPMLLHAIMGGIIGYLFSHGKQGFNVRIGGQQ